MTEREIKTMNNFHNAYKKVQEDSKIENVWALAILTALVDRFSNEIEVTSAKALILEHKDEIRRFYPSGKLFLQSLELEELDHEEQSNLLHQLFYNVGALYVAGLQGEYWNTLRDLDSVIKQCSPSSKDLVNFLASFPIKTDDYCSIFKGEKNEK